MFVLTGTYAYDPVAEESDIDIVTNSEECAEIEATLIAHGIEVDRTEAQESYGPNSGFYFDIGPLKFNIINCGSDMDKVIWKYATGKMKETDPIENRALRLMEFQTHYNKAACLLGRPTQDRSQSDEPSTWPDDDDLPF